MQALVTLTCRDVVLRSLKQDDMDHLFAWRNDLENLALWSPRRYPVTYEEFEQEFQVTERNETHIRMMVVHRDNTVGTVYSCAYSPLHGWAYINLYLASDARVNGIGPIAWGLFANYLFTSLPIRKLYAEVYSFNSLSRRTLEKAGLELQAQLPEHCFWDGEYHDKLIFALTRERLSIIRDFLECRKK